MTRGFLSSILYTRACTSTGIVATLNNISTLRTRLSNPPNHLGTGFKLFSTSVSYGHCIRGSQATKWNGRNRKGRMSTKAMGSGFLGFGKKKTAMLPEIVKAGDPVLHEPAMEVAVEEIGSERIQKIIDDMISVMRDAPGVGIAASQIGIPLQIIVLEDTEEYISYAPKEETKSQKRTSFDLLVIINPKLKLVGDKTAKFFEGCLSVDGYRGLVERHLEVEVTGLGRDGLPIKVDANGWQARILQHECDHLAGLLYVDKMIPRTFRTVENLRLPLAAGCPKPGIS